MNADAAAQHLLAHRQRQATMDDLPPDLRPADLAGAYRVQELLVGRLLEESGGGVIGYKVACTNPIAQEALKIDRPLFGRLLSSTTFGSPAALPAERFLHRVIEAEFGIRMGTTVPEGSGPHTATTIAEHVGEVLPSIEVVDHRFFDWSLGALPWPPTTPSTVAGSRASRQPGTGGSWTWRTTRSP